MIGWFPAPYPDELFYSICARYSRWMQYSSTAARKAELIELASTRTIVDLPRDLCRFVTSLSTNDHYTVDRIVDQHTLFGFYAPFLLPKSWRQVRAEMEVSTDTGPNGLLSLRGSYRPRTQVLRYCPACIASDRQCYGETYWHRQHQLPGVDVCLVHQVLLESSSIVFQKNPRTEFYPAEDVVQLNQIRNLDGNSRYASVLLTLARDGAWLLSHTSRLPEFPFVANGYFSVLLKRFTRRDGDVNSKLLVEAFKDTFPVELFLSFCCTTKDRLEGNVFPSVRRFVRSVRRREICGEVWSFHPMYFLLTAQVLGVSFDVLLEHCRKIERRDLMPSPPLLGLGPYPCTNSACQNFKRLVLPKERVLFLSLTTTSSTTCACGYSYLLSDYCHDFSDSFPQRSTERFSVERAQTAREKWRDPSLTFADICEDLRVDPPNLIYNAALLGFKFPRIGPRGTTVELDRACLRRFSRPPRKRAKESDLIDVHRNRWQRTLQDNPGATATGLQKHLAASTYRWLRRHDLEWLKTHQKVQLRRAPSSRIEDPVSFDQQLAARVQEAARCLRETSGRPIQVTLRAIASHIPEPRLLSGALPRKRFPATSKMLSEVVESYSSFAFRTIQWMAAWYKRENIEPTRAQFLKHLHLNENRINNLPEFEAALEKALADCRSSVRL